MNNTYIKTPNAYINWDGKSDLSISYVDIMTMLKVYTVPKAGLVLTDEQKKLNELIESVTSFNLNIFARVYYPHLGKLVSDEISNGAVDEFLSINKYQYKDIMDLSSIALYGTTSLSLSFKYDDYIKKLLDESTDDESTAPEFAGCTIYFTIESPQIDGTAELYTVRMNCKNETDSSDKDKEEHEDTNEKEFDDSDDIIDIDPGKDDTQDGSAYIDDSNYIQNITANISNRDLSRYVFINSMQLSDILATDTGGFEMKSKFLHVYINPICPKEFNLTVTVKTTNILTNKITVKKKVYTYTPTSVNITNPGSEHVYKMNNPDVSYALLRVNPKLTGNVKVVVDSNSNIYLDTFKISDTMSHRKYRHISVGSDTYYGKSLMAKFKDIPTSEFYKIPDRCYSLFTPAQTYKAMYFDTYNSGVSTNTDELYSENFAMLAPLCVKRVMPDFFLIFKVDKNADDYDEASMTDTQKMEYFIKNGKLVKSYDMRNDSNIGKYIRNIYDNAKSYVGDLFASYDTNNYNKFIGISLDHGVVTQAYESGYKQEEAENQVALNDFFTLGFERNHLVSKDIINFEFLFNDVEDEMFSVNTYFGLYVKLNTCSDSDFSCIGTENSEDSSIIKYLYDASINTFNTSGSFDNIPQYAQLIYGVSTDSEFIRLNRALQYSSCNVDFMLKPYKNILTANINRADSSKCKSFITLKLNDILDVGDHIRIIIPELKTMYEIVMSDKDSTDILSGTYMDEHRLTDVVTNYYNTNAAGWTIYRVGMFIPYKKNLVNLQSEYNEETETVIYSGNSYGAELLTQVEQLFFALKKFNVPDVVTAWKYNDNTLSIISQYENTVFERICSPSGFVQSQQNYIQSTTDEDKTIEFLGSVYPDKTILNIETNWQNLDKFYLYPIHFEFIGTRMAYIMDFIKVNDISNDTIYSVKVDDINIFDNKSIVYLQTDSSSLVSTLYNDIPVYTYKNSNGIVDSSLSYVRWVTAYDNLDNTVLNLRNPVIMNSQISLYNAYKINAGICSILQVKDFDYDVLDADDALLDYEQDSVIGNKGEYSEKSIFNLTAAKEDESDIPDVENNKYCKFVDSGNESSIIDELNQGVLERINKLDELNIKLADAKAAYDDAVLSLSNAQDAGADEDIIEELQAEVEDASAKSVECEDAYLDSAEEFDNYKNDEYICFPVYRKTNNDPDIMYDIYDIVSFYYKRKIVYKESTDDTPGSWVWGDKSTDDAAISFTVPTAYKASVLRSTSEESIKDYIDKYHILNDSSIRNSVWYGTNEESSRSNFLKSIFDKNHNKFDITVLSPYCCKWKSIGTDARGETYRLMYYDSSIDASSYYVAGSGDTDCSTYVGYLYAPANTAGLDFQYTDTKKYITRSFNHTVISETSSKQNVQTFKDYILNGNGAIDDLIYNTNIPDCRFSTVYLSGDNTIEFISSGIKFRIHSNNDNIVNFNNYIGYSVIFIVLPMVNQNYKKDTELIIDETNNEILLIWYNPAKTLKMGYAIDPAESANASNAALYPVNIDFTLSDLNVKYIRESSNNAGSDAYLSISIPDSFSIGSKKMYYDGFRIINQTEADTYTPAATDPATTQTYRTSHKGVQLSKNSAYLYISTTQTNDSAYSRIKTGAISAELNPVKPLFDNILETFPYYSVENYITGINPVAHYMTSEETATNAKIESLLNSTSGIPNTYIITDKVIPEISADVSYSKLSSVVNNISVYVKNADGVKDFTNVSNLLNITLVDPITHYKYKTELGRVHSTYSEPVMKNIFEFDYSTGERTNRLLNEYESFDAADKIDNIFEKSFDGANLSIKNVNKIAQMWINKYTEDSNYCINDTAGNAHYRLAVDVLHNYSVMHDPWFFPTYRKYGLNDYYNVSNKETVKREFYTNVYGYETGYELKSFFNSKATVLNGSDGNTIEITSWKNTKISKYEKYIKLNVTDSIVYNILFRNAYMKSWKSLGNISNGNKIDYIKNTILNFININNKTKFVLATDYVKTNVLSFNTDYNDDAEVVTNFKNELKYENGKYYMYIYPEDMYTFYAKMTIKL